MYGWREARRRDGLLRVRRQLAREAAAEKAAEEKAKAEIERAKVKREGEVAK